LNGTINLVRSLDFIGIKYFITFACEDVDFRDRSMFKTEKELTEVCVVATIGAGGRF